MTATLYTGTSVSTELVQNTILVSQALGNGLESFSSDPAIAKARPTENGYHCHLNTDGLSADKTITLNQEGQAERSFTLKSGRNLKKQLETTLKPAQAAAPKPRAPKA
ncbi:MAG: hypothetical protein ACQEQL_06655 [Pseudomonadota bacterium]